MCILLRLMFLVTSPKFKYKLLNSLSKFPAKVIWFLCSMLIIASLNLRIPLLLISSFHKFLKFPSLLKPFKHFCELTAIQSPMGCVNPSLDFTHAGIKFIRIPLASRAYPLQFKQLMSICAEGE